MPAMPHACYARGIAFWLKRYVLYMLAKPDVAKHLIPAGKSRRGAVPWLGGLDANDGKLHADAQLVVCDPFSSLETNHSHRVWRRKDKIAVRAYCGKIPILYKQGIPFPCRRRNECLAEIEPVAAHKLAAADCASADGFALKCLQYRVDWVGAHFFGGDKRPPSSLQTGRRSCYEAFSAFGFCERWQAISDENVVIADHNAATNSSIRPVS